MSLDNTPQPSVKYCADKVERPASLSAMVWALSKRLVAAPQFCEGAGIKALLQKRIDPPVSRAPTWRTTSGIATSTPTP